MNITTDKLNPYFRHTFDYFCSHYLNVDEDLVWLGNIARIFDRYANDQVFKPYAFGFLVISSQRIFRAFFYTQQEYRSPSFQPVRPYLTIWQEDISKVRSQAIIAPINSPLSSFEISQFTVSENQNLHLMNASLTTGISIKDSAFETGKPISGILMMFLPNQESQIYFYNTEDGFEVYSILQEIIKNNIDLIYHKKAT